MAHHEAKAPAIGKALRIVAPNLVERLDLVSTAGSMQVKMVYAQRHPVSKDLARTEARSSMYTLEGGVRYGTLRLLDTADYDAPVHRFGDFNTEVLASRNTSFQAHLWHIVCKSVAFQRRPALVQ